MQKFKKIESAVGALLCLCTALSLFMSFDCPKQLLDSDSSFLVNILDNFYYSLRSAAPEFCLGFAACLMLRRHFKPERKNLLLRIACLAVAAVWLMAECFRIDNTLDALSQGPGQLAKAAVYLLGSYNLLMLLSTAALQFLTSGRDLKDGPLFAALRRHSFLSFFCAILLCSLPTLAVCFPGYMCSDSYCQLAYYFDIYEFVSHHPPVHTLLISWPVKLGMMLGSSNLGLYAVVCVQMLVFSAVFAYMLHTMTELSAPRWLICTSFLTVVLSSVYITAAAVVLKDNVYSYGVLLFCIELVYMLRLREDYLKSPQHIALLCLSVLMVMLLRNNGKYLMYVMLPVLVLLFAAYGIKQGKIKKAALGAGVLVAPVLLSLAVHSAVMSHYDIAPGSRREALSLPLQQTARLIFEQGDSISEEDRAVIDSIISYDDIGAEYKPTISDPVKQYFRDECSNADIINYAKVWLRQGLKAPHVYLKATVNQNYPLVYPWDISVFQDLDTESALHYHISEPLGLHDVEFAGGLEDAFSAVNRFLALLPVPGFTSSLPCCVLLLMLLCIEALRKKKGLFLLCALPALITIGTIVLAPLVDVRYGFAAIYTMPLLSAVYLWDRA